MGSLRWRRYRHLVALIALIALVLVVVFGDVRIAAITSSERTASEAEVTHNIDGAVDLFDDTVVHELAVTFDPAEYDDLIKTYQNEGEKEYIEATITIDGTTIDQVGIRLKGNSTLIALRQDSPFGGRGRIGPPSECVPAGMGQAGASANGTPTTATPTTGTPEAATDAGGFGAGGPGFGGNVSVEDPSSLPWLISFDEYVEGRRYQGQGEIAVRPLMGNETSLNEAVALTMVGAAGEPTQRAAYSSFSMNGSEESLRLIVESPSDAFVARNFDTDGVLYKALATGNFAYAGDDPTAYETSFDQVTAKNHQDLKPLIDLLKWVSEASDEEFAAELDQHVDVASLARYIALQQLLDNFDDMAGPGKNYYLWYDLETERFTVLTWDLNLALSGFGGPGGRGPGGMDDADFDAMQACMERVRGEEGSGGGGPGGGMRMGHPLKERFLAAPRFHALYEQQYTAVYDALYGGGQALAELDRLAAVVTASGLIEETTIETEVAALRTKLETQTAAGPVPQVSPEPEGNVSTGAAAATPTGS